MNKYLTKGRIALLVIFSVLIADQIIKIYVKTHMYWHQSENAIKWLYEKLGMVDAEPPTWFYIYFTENNGMRSVWRYSVSYSLPCSVLLP